MGMNAILTIAEGMGAMADANRATEVSTANDLIQIIPTAFNLTMAYLNKLSEAHWKYFVAVESITEQNPQEAATASADYAKYQMLSTEMSKASQKQNTFIEALKSALTNLEQSSPYKMMDSFGEFQKAVCNLILNVFRG